MPIRDNDCNVSSSEIITTGYNGWTPVYAIVASDGVTEGVGDFRILKIVGYEGGTGPEPYLPTALLRYVGPAGFTNIAGATDIRGPIGLTGAAGANGANGADGADGADLLLYEFSDGDLDAIVINGVYMVYESPIGTILNTPNGVAEGILIHDDSELFSLAPGDAGKLQYFFAIGSASAGGFFKRRYSNLGMSWNSWTEYYPSGTKDQGSNAHVIKTAIVDIGDWDMDTTTSVSVAHGLTYDNILSVDVLIFTDSDAIPPEKTSIFRTIYGLNTDFDGFFTVDATNVNLTRRTGGGYDSANYNATSYNRGIIKILYIE